ncbi:AraC family transcriptional regulator [Salinisphaera sp. PC39]|uniref:AraC family transcriptional regulator n=1 Tax=Salinisphaera sp. PC39 TaxID=1304156 RepID=UPI003340D4C8
MDDLSVPAVVLPSWVKAAARCGINVKPIFAAHGIELDLSRLEDRTVSLSALDRVLEDCIARAGDDHFPFVVGETFAFEYLPDLETYLTTSSSLRDAARVLEWIPALVNPMIDAGMDEIGDEARLVLRLAPEAPTPGKPYHAEIFFASILKFARSLLGEEVRLTSLHFRHRAPPHAGRYHGFFRMPVYFERPRDELVFPRELLDRPLEGDFPALHRQAEALVEQRVARLTGQGLGDRLAAALARDPALLAGGLDAAAAAFGLGPRTLQRRLRDEGCSFGTVQDAARYRRAAAWLDEPDADIEAISEALGFADRRSFTRAFRRWTGMSPSAYRARGRGV